MLHTINSMSLQKPKTLRRETPTGQFVMLTEGTEKSIKVNLNEVPLC